MKRFLFRQLDSTTDFLLSPLGTTFSVPGIIVSGGILFYIVNTCEWRVLRRTAKTNIEFIKDTLKRDVWSRRERDRFELELEMLKRYRRETWFPSFNPPPLPSLPQ